MGKQCKTDKKALSNSLHDHVSRARASITVMTSSWGNCTPGPLGLCVPQDLISASVLKTFNEKHIGEAFAVQSGNRSHFMNGATFNEMLYNLYAQGFDLQRRNHGLTIGSKGKFLADAWSGFRSSESGESVERSNWEKLNNVQMPILG